MSIPYEKKGLDYFAKEPTSTSFSDQSLKVLRTPRFAGVTTVYAPIEAGEEDRSPYTDSSKTEKTQSCMAGGQPSNIGFGYINDPSRKIDNLSPTFREEQILKKHEEMTEKEQARDLIIKSRVRTAKFFLRGVNLTCSLIVLSMLSITFSIFNATKALPPRNNLPAWAVGTKTWPQKVVLSVACISLALCLVVFWNYWRGGHRRAEKVAVYHTLFAVVFFIFSTVMWGIAAGILQSAKNTNNNKDVWGWSCVDNKRRQVFADKVDYALVCRMQSWSLVCCLIEVILECITILLYSVVFYRYYSKQRLRESMDVRDRARSDLYLAQLRSQSAPK